MATPSKMYELLCSDYDMFMKKQAHLYGKGLLNQTLLLNINCWETFCKVSSTSLG